MKEIEKRKDYLLKQPMNMLGLGRLFNAHFYNGKRLAGKPLMFQDDVLTLKEFISFNKEIINKDTPFVVTRPENRGKKFDLTIFAKNRTAWYQLRNFLKENGFDHNDWIHLVPDVKSGKRGMVPDYSLLDKNYLLSTNIHSVTDMRRGRLVAKLIEEHVQKRKQYAIAGKLTVKDILDLTERDVKNIQNGFPSYHRAILISLNGVQSKFRLYGFTEAYGPFMAIQFFPENVLA